jgi:hypothetical protein
MHRRDAGTIAAAYGPRAHQYVVDRIADAVRSGQDEDALHYEKVLREVERIRLDEPGRSPSD